MKFRNKRNNISSCLINYILQNKFLFGVLLFYSLLMLSIINWGIPNQNHPFAYNMDEWHQLQAVRTTIKNFSPNVSGSSHGTMFHFILTGVYLTPFFVFGAMNPFILNSPVDLLDIQQKLFVILRLNTLIFGILSIFFIAKIAKEYLRINQNITVILFVVTPLWLSLSNYFKYDIALVFWIISSLFYLFKFSSKPSLRNYLIAGVFCSLAVATKISALPILLIYSISYFWFMKKNKWKLNESFWGIILFFGIFLLLGVPDLILGKGDWREFLYSNLVSGSSGYSNILTGFNAWWQYILLKIMPIDFGYGFIIIYVIGISYWLAFFLKSLIKKKFTMFKNEFFLLFCFLVFTASLVPLKLGANGNRLLVLLPFFALLSGVFLQRLKKSLNNLKIVIWIIFILIFVIQFYQSAIMIYIKWLPDVRVLSSKWMKENLAKGTLIGVENIPIYQLLPDVVIKEFYSIDRKFNHSASFSYKVIDASSRSIPSIVVVTGKELDLYYFKKSQKKQLVERLMREGYREKIEFKPFQALYLFSENELNYSVSGLAPISTISVFEKVK